MTKIRTDIWEYQDNCPVCKAAEVKSTFICESNLYSSDYRVEGKIALCANCGSFYSQNFLPESRIADYYKAEYYTRKPIDLNGFWIKNAASIFADDKKGKFSGLALLMRLIFELGFKLIYFRRLERLKFPQASGFSSKMLEFGHGKGDYLLVMKMLGWDVIGIDLDTTHSEFLQTLGINTVTSFKPDVILPGSIDFVFTYHALEHVYDIDETLSEIHSSLRPGGEVHIGVPCASGLIPRLFKKNYYDLGFPIHRQLFSRAGFKEIAARHDFIIKNIRFRSYPETLLGTILTFLFDRLNFSNDREALKLTNSMTGKIIGLFLTPFVFFLDVLGLGDRIEVTLSKHD